MQQQKRGNRKRGVIVCAWCSRYIGAMKDLERVSHGICLECKSRELERWEGEELGGRKSGRLSGGPFAMVERMGEGPGHP
jgi:hypothetical protein